MAEDYSLKTQKNVELNIDDQVSVLTALLKHKPVGVARHFHMVCIQDFVNEEVSASAGVVSTKDGGITSDQIWAFLNTLYDLQALESTEPVPFPNQEVEFVLPFGEFGQVFKERKRFSATSEKEETSSNPEQHSSAAESKRKADKLDDSNSRSSTPAKKSHR